MPVDLARIEGAIDKTVAAGTEIQMGFGGVQFQTMVEIMEFAKLMAISGAAVPYHLRLNAGACLAICTRALRFNFDPYALAEHSFVMKKSQKNEAGQWENIETIAYDSFVIHAIIEAHAPLTGRLRHRYEGEGDEMKCVVWGTPKGETEPLEHETITVGEIVKALGTNEKGVLKGSPMWLTDRKQQLWYHARRQWCRKYYPEILLGWYDKDELEAAATAHAAEDITPRPDIGKRLAGRVKGTRGFSVEHVMETVAPKSETEGEKPTVDQEGKLL